jgi:hypothetical protein
MPTHPNPSNDPVPTDGAVVSDLDLLTLSYGEIAIALHVAGLPARWRQMSTRDLIDLALHGVAKIGLDEVLRIYAQSHRVLVLLSAPGKAPAAEVSQARNQLRQIWPSRRSRQNAIDAAWTIFHPIKPKSEVVAHNTGHRWITN